MPVKAGLERQHVARHQLVGLGAADVRRLVWLEAHAVAERVKEPVAQYLAGTL